MSGGSPSLEEQWAMAVVSQVTGAQVIATDIAGAAAGTVDAEIQHGDGRAAPLEVTRLGQQAVFHLRSKLREIRYSRPNPGNGKWLVAVGAPDDLQRLLGCYGRVIQICEKHRVLDPRRLPQGVLEIDADLIWLTTNRRSGMMCVTPVGAFETSREVTFMEPLDSRAAYGGNHVAAAMNGAFDTDDNLKRHVNKLIRSSGDERHLFVIVDSSGIEGAAFFDLFAAFSLPDEDLIVPLKISHIWLLAQWESEVTIWERGVGWRHAAFDIGQGSD
jgi:hypothetical protein